MAYHSTRLLAWAGEGGGGKGLCFCAICPGEVKKLMDKLCCGLLVWPASHEALGRAAEVKGKEKEGEEEEDEENDIRFLNN